MSVTNTDALQIARRYATAIFSLALEGKKQAVVVGELAVLADAIEGNAALAGALANPVITNAEKTAALTALVAKGDTLTKRAVATIADGGRGSLIPAIAADLKSRLAAHEGEVEAVVTSARPLPAATKKQLERSLAMATGKTVTLAMKEDASVLGGLKIELGSLRLDATLAGALNTMRGQLLATTHS